MNNTLETTTTKFANLAPVHVTPTALNELRQLLYEHEVSPENGIRVGVKGGGCSGLSYILGFDKKQDEDEEFTIDGVHFFMNPAHGMYLMGMEIDYINGLNNRGFTFQNPNATSSCGCGSSFAV